MPRRKESVRSSLDEESDDEDNNEFFLCQAVANAPDAIQEHGMPKKRRVIADDNDDDDDDSVQSKSSIKSSPHDDEPDEKLPRKPAIRSSPRSRDNAATKRAYLASDSSESDEEFLAKARHSLTPKVAVAAAAAQTASLNNGRTVRASVRQANKKLLQTSSSKASRSNVDDSILPKFLQKKKAKHNSDDDEFTVDSSDNDDEELASNVEADEEESFVGSVDKSVEESDDDVVVVKKAAFVGPVGDAEESNSDSDNVNAKKKTPTLNQSPKLTFRRQSRAERLNFSPLDELASSSSSSSDDSSHNAPDIVSPPKLVACLSDVDVITDEPLPQLHICYFSPDGSNRQCFCLSTLRKIALTSPYPKYRQVLGVEKQTFLQPPHFRTAMSDDLLDQIASRFGRDALDINGSYYDENKGKYSSVDDYEFDDPQLEEFNDKVNKFVQSCMGSSDLYVCPLCYTVAHHRLVNGEYSSIRSSFSRVSSRTRPDEKYSLDYAYDPLSILGCIDDEEFEIASTFCFRKVAACKVHLRNDHHVKTTLVKGNDLYARYKIRATDGLLQRWIKRTYKQTLQGDLQRYWFEGNNYSFVQVLSYVYQAEDFRDVTAARQKNDDTDDDDNASTSSAYENALAFLRPSLAFFNTFKKDAKELWDTIALPYEENQANDMDFIDEEIEDDEPPNASDFRQADMDSFKRQLDDDTQYARQLEERYANDFGDQEDGYEVEGQSDEDSSVIIVESDNQEDDWVTSRTKHPVKTSRRKNIRSRR